MKTLIHKNLHNGLWALTQKGRVVGYCTAATIVDCDTKEDRKKAEFSRTGGKRTVHLWVRGTLAQVEGFQPRDGRELVLDSIQPPACDRVANYNPKRGENGFQVEGQLWTGGKAAMFTSHMTVS